MDISEKGSFRKMEEAIKRIEEAVDHVWGAMLACQTASRGQQLLDVYAGLSWALIRLYRAKS